MTNYIHGSTFIVLDDLAILSNPQLTLRFVGPLRKVTPQQRFVAQLSHGDRQFLVIFIDGEGRAIDDLEHSMLIRQSRSEPSWLGAIENGAANSRVNAFDSEELRPPFQLYCVMVDDVSRSPRFPQEVPPSKMESLLGPGPDGAIDGIFKRVLIATVIACALVNLFAVPCPGVIRKMGQVAGLAN